MNQRIAIVKELEAAVSLVSERECQAFLNYFTKDQRIFFAGAGRSGLALKGFAMRVMHLGYPAHVVGEITAPNIRENDVLIIASGSGQTESLVSYAKKARALNATVLLVTANADSTIGAIAESVIKIPGPSPKVAGTSGFVSIQPMASLFEQVLYITLDSLVLALMERDQMTGESMYERHANLE